MSLDLAVWLHSMTEQERYQMVSQQPHLADALLDEVFRLRAEVAHLQASRGDVVAQRDAWRQVPA